ncbi:DUF805 domain-containing protein [Enterobacteriaceae bacterium ESL0689]|nr:DUF805 domain-containing protein [Enterobacteriaceae bacterium ESL0689]
MKEDFWDCYWTGWNKTLVFQGGASRKEFWSFMLVNTLFLVAVFAGIIYWLLSQRDGFEAMLVVCLFCPPGLFIIFLFLLPPTLSVGIRRMHDIGYSEWWFGGMMLLNTLIILIILSGYFLYPSILMDIYDMLIALCAIAAVISVGVSILCCKPGKIKDCQLHSTEAE